ncbi:hypothetical protein M408DRAFT_30109 [Serendipita vermifera MAFF 305830]|uniref:Uncharacterized protein n=1 Tax=Serendipita vermifera MAFF 305830 TaxID=933852 RepID=A0A0C3ANB0_SERVB|nr:hypothetical protein M408DRAFT_30109 [Serendipita vermifera MAFF 305830]
MAPTRNNGRRNAPSPLDLSTTGHNSRNRANLQARTKHEASGSEPLLVPTPPCQPSTQSAAIVGVGSNAGDAHGPLKRAGDGTLVQAPTQAVMDDSQLPSSLPSQAVPVVYAIVDHLDVTHAHPDQLRIQRLHPKERQIVTTDGGNTVESQKHVLETLEGLSVDSDGFHAWTIIRVPLGEGREQIQYWCRASDRNTRERCQHVSYTPQKARQHFVSCAVDISCWTCPFQDICGAPKYKRLDDLKHHHIQPVHRVQYSRPRGGGSISRRKSKEYAIHDDAEPGPSTANDVPSPEQEASSSTGVIRSGPSKARTVRKTLAAGPSTSTSRKPRVQRVTEGPVMTNDSGAPPPLQQQQLLPTSSTSPYPVATSSTLVSPLATSRPDLLSPVDHRQTWNRPSSTHAHAHGHTYPSSSLSPADIGRPLLSPSLGGGAMSGFPSGPTIGTAPSVPTSPFGGWPNLSVGAPAGSPNHHTHMPGASSSAAAMPSMEDMVGVFTPMHRGGAAAAAAASARSAFVPHVPPQDGIPGNDPPIGVDPHYSSSSGTRAPFPSPSSASFLSPSSAPLRGDGHAQWMPQHPAAWNNFAALHASQVQHPPTPSYHGTMTATTGHAYNTAPGAGPSRLPQQHSPTSPYHGAAMAGNAHLPQQPPTSPYNGTATTSHAYNTTPGVGSSHLSPTSPLMFPGQRRGSGNGGHPFLSPHDYTTPGLSGYPSSAVSSPAQGRFGNVTPASGGGFHGPSAPTLRSPSNQAGLDIFDASHEPSLYPDLFNPDSNVSFYVAPSSAPPSSSYYKAAEEPSRL